MYDKKTSDAISFTIRVLMEIEKSLNSFLNHKC